MAMLLSPMKCYSTVSEVKPGSTNVNICVETSGKLFNQHGDAIITNTIKSSHGQSSYLKLFLSSTVYIFFRQWRYNYSVGNHFFQTLAKMASGLKLLLAKMKKSSPCLASDIFFKLANKYQINNTVMFNNLFCRF